MINVGKLLGIGVAAVLASSCQNSEWQVDDSSKFSDRAIIFTSAYTTSRAESGTHNAWKENDKVGVMAYCSASNQGVNLEDSPWDAKKDFVTPDIFYNEALTFNGAGLWDYNWNNQGLHPWLENMKALYTFIAYYPYVPLEGSSSAQDRTASITTVDGKNLGQLTFSGDQYKGEPKIAYTVPYSGMRGAEPREPFLLPDLMLAISEDRIQGNGTVDLAFEHMFAGLEFEVNNYVIDQPITIESIEFAGNGFYRSMQMKGINRNSYEVSGEDLYGGAFTVAQQVDLEGATGNAETGEIVPAQKRIEGTLLFIVDQNNRIIPEGKTCSIKVSLSTGEPVTMELNATTFTRGTKTIFSINYVGDDFVIQVRSDNNWEIGGDDDIIFD